SRLRRTAHRGAGRRLFGACRVRRGRACRCMDDGRPLRLLEATRGLHARFRGNRRRGQPAQRRLPPQPRHRSLEREDLQDHIGEGVRVLMPRFSRATMRLGAMIMGAALCAPLPLHAQEGAGALKLGLDSLQPAGANCRVTLVEENGLGSDVTGVAYEFVFFDRDGRVELLTVLDLKALPDGRTRVRQFDLPGLDCATISRLLINDATKCEGPGLAPDACL